MGKFNFVYFVLIRVFGLHENKSPETLIRKEKANHRLNFVYFVSNFVCNFVCLVYFVLRCEMKLSSSLTLSTSEF